MSSEQQSEVYRSDQLLARFAGGSNSEVCVVTFTSYTDDYSLERPGFGEAFFAKRGIDAVHVISKGNFWYLHGETRALCAAVAGITKPYRRVVAYGSSMGGYAAIRLGALAGAGTAIAISPQFTLDPARVPFENRWMEASVLDFSVEAELNGLPFAPVAYVAYDPRNIDRWHVNLFDLHTCVIRIPLPFSGHPTSGFLQQTGLLSELVLRILDDTFDAAGFRREARLRRSRSSDYFMALAEACTSPRRRVALASRAVALTDDDPEYVARQLWWLALAGEPGEALVRLKQITASPGAPARAYYFLSCVHELQGHLDQALAAMDELMATFPASRHLQMRRDHLAARVDRQRLNRRRLVGRATAAFHKWRRNVLARSKP